MTFSEKREALYREISQLSKAAAFCFAGYGAKSQNDQLPEDDNFVAAAEEFVSKYNSYMDSNLDDDDDDE